MKKILDPLAVVAFAAALMLSGLFIGPAIATQPNKWLYPNLVVPNNGTFGGTVTAAAFSGPLTATTGSYSSTLDVVGQATFGAATTKSTFTTAGAFASYTSITAGTSVTATTSVNATTALAVTAGPLKLYVRTLAQLQAITPAAGDVYLCSNCAIPYQIAVGTGAVINGFMQASDGAGLQ